MVLIIAEAGVNHNGDENLALKLIDCAHNAGADIVKFQTFNAKKLATHQARKAKYQLSNDGIEESQFDMLSRLELSYDSFHRLHNHCLNLGIEFLSSESLKFLVNDLKLQRLKVASGEITNAPLLLEHAKTQCDVILSTGMASLDEIEAALGVLAFGYTAANDTQPTREAFSKAFTSQLGQQKLKEKVTLLHCTTEYPAPISEVNLRAMHTIKDIFGVPTGYSDHTAGINIAIAAAASGACIIEKHFTLDRNSEGPDHKASLEPNDLKAMIAAIRQVDMALGDGIKRPTQSEIANKDIARKSIVAVCDINKGDIFSDNNIAIKRPGTGKSPYLYWDVLGTKALRSIKAGEVLDE
jgi:N-acetylneuraminate synthase